MTRIFHPVGIYSLTLPRRLRVIQVCRFVVYFRTILVLPVVPLLALRRHEAILVDKSFHPKNFMHTHASLDDSFWKTWIHEKKKGKPFPRSTTESQPTTRTRTGSWRITGPQNYSTTLDTGPRITATARSRLWNVWDNFSHPYFPRTMMMTTTTTCSRSHKDQWKCGGEWKSSEKKWEKLLTTTIPRTGTPSSGAGRCHDGVGKQICTERCFHIDGSFTLAHSQSKQTLDFLTVFFWNKIRATVYRKRLWKSTPGRYAISELDWKKEHF